MNPKITFPMDENLYREFKAIVARRGKKIKDIGYKLVFDYVKKESKK